MKEVGRPKGENADGHIAPEGGDSGGTGEPTDSEHPGEPTDPELAAEAEDDWNNGANPVLDEILIDLEHVSEPTKEECSKLVIRIKRKGTMAVSQGMTVQQAVLLNLIIDVLMFGDV